ncbi:amino acid adenylation domain-containing protein [Neobacillus mesonae]|nr:amino acid adenylation domain-containing protein [Neobacillus mesonae]
MSKKYKMSSAQKRLFVLNEMHPLGIAYNIPILIRLEGKIEKDKLQSALQLLCQRHEPLRTRFSHIKDKFLQIIEDEVRMELDVEQAGQDEISSMFQLFIRPFNLDQAPLMRAKLVSVSETEHMLMLDIHHIIFDDGSTDVLLSDLACIYNGTDLPELRIQYKDYSAWQQSRDLTKQEEYWLSQYGEEAPVLNLKTDFPRPQQQSHVGASIVTRLPEKYQGAVRELVQHTGATEYMILLTAYMQLLSNYAGQAEVMVGSPIAGRVHPESEQMIGMFVNTLVLQGNMKRGSSFIDSIEHMKNQCLDAYEHQEYPFEVLVEKVAGERDLSRNPLFDVMFVLQNSRNAEAPLLLGDASMLPANVNEFHFTVSKFDLTLSMENTRNGYELHWEYCADLFRKETIERMADHFANLLGNALKQPDKALSELSMLGEDEEQRVLREFNDTKRPYPENMTVIELFEEQVKRVPNQVAAEYNGEQLTYRELNHRANAIGRVLKAHGVGPDRIVGLVTGRSLEMIAGMYGILKAGGAYLPIDPEHPADRIRYMLEDSGAEVVLVGPGGEKAQPALEGRTLVQLTDWRHEVLEDPECKAKPGNLAYIIYTSGTTGNPKGVMIENRSLVNLAAWQRSEGGMNEHSVMLQKSTYIFDAAVWEIFSSGLSGSKLVIATETENQDPAALLELIAKQQVTDALIVPSSFRMLLEYAETHQLGSKLTSLQHIYLGAEAVTNDLLEGYQRVTGHGLSRLNNLYGPTEGTVCVTSLRFKEGDGGVVPIGKPLWNTRIYMLNGESLCGIGVPGEICIAGAGVARGYLNQPELTAEQFVNHPVLGERLYRTGDIGRWLPDGSIEYMGRKGEQVKLRGFRIELGEIESRLREMKGIQDAVVIVRTDGGDPKLCGYLVSESELDMREVKEQLKKSLPYYMIPSHFMQLASMPQTRSGKLDKKALPKPDREEGSTYVAPRDETERCVAEVFEEILGMEHVGVHDNFYEMGGDSIKAIRIVSKLRERGYEISVRSIMQGKSIRSVREDIKAAVVSNAEQNEVNGIVPLTPIQHQFFNFKMDKPHHFNQSYMLESEEPIREKDLDRALEIITNHHDILRAVFTGGTQTIRPSSEGKFYELKVWDYSKFNRDHDVLSLMLTEADRMQSEINLEKGPLLKVGLFKVNDCHYLLLIIHHLIVDGVSWRILVDDLYQSYRFSSEPGWKLPEKTTSYKTWSEALATYREDYRIKKEIPFWTETEQRVNSGASLLREVNSSIQGTGAIEIALDETDTYNLLYKSNRAYRTEINDLLLTALFRSVFQLKGASDISVQLEGHGREHIVEGITIDRTVGWFTSVYPVSVAGIGESMEEDIRITKEQLRRIPNRGLGYSVLRELGSKVLQGAAPEVTFNYLGVLGQESGNNAWKWSEVSRGDDVAPVNRFGTPISINGAVTDSRLQMTLSYHLDQCKAEDMELLASIFQNQLKQVIEHCTNQQNPTLTASDYGELVWSSEDFIAAKQKIETDGYEIERIYPLTPLQEGMLYHKLMEEDSQSYVVQTLYSTKHRLSYELLKQSLELLVSKHSILRTCIIHDSVSEPRQVLIKGRSTECHFIDLSGSDHASRRVESVQMEDARRGFHLEKDSLIRLHVIKISDEDYQILISFHHIIMDGWCMSILMNDLIHNYTLLEQGGDMEKIKKSIHKTTDFEHYVRLMQEKDQASGLIYWKELLRDYSEQTHIHPEGIITAGSKEAKAEREEIRLSEEESKGLEQIGAKYGVTINTVVEAAWGILLQRYSRTEDAVFGKVVSGRNEQLKDIENMIGLFINTIPVRVTSTQSMSFAQLLTSLQEQAITSGHYDFSSLTEVQGLTDLGSELFQTILAFENYYEQKPERSTELELFLEQGREQTNYPLTLVSYKADTLALGLMYDSSLYDKEEVCRILVRLKAILLAAVHDPEMAIGDVVLLGPAEVEEIHTVFNEKPTEYPSDCTIIELFEEQAMRTPDRTAVVTPNGELSYAELNRKSNQLSRVLREKGLGRDQFAGVMAERRLETIIGLLAILKAGGAYLPIDPKYPISRLQYIMKNSGAHIVLACDSELKSICDEEVSIVDMNDPRMYAGQDKNLEIVNTPQDLAYLIYTSGTTGEPKGVMIEHRSILRLVKNTNYADFSNCKILQTGSLAFDASTFEIWGALLNGGTLYMVEEEVLTSSKHLENAIERFDINTMWLTVSLFNQLVAEDRTSLSHLKQLLIGGEQLSEHHVKRFKEQNGSTRLINGYGPTETTTFAVTHEIEGEFKRPIPIGKPISNTEVIVMNGKQLCGIGIPGELLIGGPGLARGYLGLPELTAERFVPHPYKEGERLYRTGDLVCWRKDGSIDYLGRLDQQVKVRGYRIELSEISARIQEQHGVLEAVAVVKEVNGEKIICGYFSANRKWDVSLLKKQITQHLPSYMMPAYLVQLDKLPVTRNGKLDTKALPQPVALLNNNYAAPRDETEKAVILFFEEILGAEGIGIHDDFLALGGHSLRATRLVNKIEQHLGVRVSLRDIMSGSSVQDIARMIKSKANKKRLLPIPVSPAKEFYEMSSAQKRLYVVDRMQGGNNLTYNMPEMLKVKGVLDLYKLQQALDQLVLRHEVLRTSFHMYQGEPVQKVAEQVDVKIDYERCGHEEEAKEIFRKFIRPFDLSTAPLVRMKVVQISDEEYILMSDFHHIIFDGRSSAIWIDELTRLYRGEKLPNVRLDYKDYSLWQKERGLKEQENYWLEEFKSGAPVLELHTDFPRPQQKSYQGSSITTYLDRAVKNSIKKLGKMTGATDYMICLSSFMLLLSRYSLQQEIVIGTPISGRVHPDTYDMLGMFVNTLAVKGNLHQEVSFEEFIRQMKEKCLKAYENQEYPFEQLVEHVAGDRDLSRHPIFDVMFALQNNEAAHPEMEGVSLEPLTIQHPIAKFDITLNMAETTEGYILNWEYASDLFRSETIELLSDHYAVLLMNAASHPEKHLSDINMTAQIERERVLSEFNDTQTEYPHDQSIIKLFERQVNLSPEKMAVLTVKSSLTYAELNARANLIARRLVHAGVKRGQFVGIIAERRIETVIAILAILKSGAAYLPLDPKNPDTRLEFMLKDSNAQIVLGFGFDHLPSACQREEIQHINILDPQLYDGDDNNPGIVSNSDDLAYLIYTSGTTGQPKGAMIEHRSISRLVQNTNYVTFEEVRILQTGSIAFDASTFEIWGALLNGGCLCLVDDDAITDAVKLELAIHKLNANTMFITTALFNQYITSHPSVFDGLTQLLFGGEATSEEHVEKFLERNTGTLLSNVYGPTESTTFATFYPIPTKNRHVKTPIGKPIANTRVYVMQEGELCGIGVPGELYISGAGVARGYLHRPELTSEKFIDDPFHPGEKMYRTGDLVRWLEDGNLEYLARMDQQVKIRGFRIELGEIESRLREISGIKDAAVVVLQDQEKYLCGYVVGSAELNITEIKDQLYRKLPSYMVPPYIVQLEKLPLSVNGKINKKDLPLPEKSLTEQYTAPRNEAEKTLVAVFEEALGVNPIGIDDSFFDLGGDSIKAIRIVSKLRDRGYDLPVRSILQGKSVRRIQSQLGISLVNHEEQGEVTGGVELIPIQREFFSFDLPNPSYFNQSFMIESNQRIQDKSLTRALDAVVKHHDALRAVFEEERQMILGMEGRRHYDLIVRDFSAIEGTSALLVLLEEEANKLQSDMDLNNGPLLKAGLFRAREKDYLFITIHHLVVDGISWRILLEDLQRGYSAAEQGRAPMLPPKTASYKTWSEFLMQYRNAEELKSELHYWKETESKIKACHSLCTGNGAMSGIGEIQLSLSPEQTDKLLYHASKAYRTEINDLLLTAVYRALHRMSGLTTFAVKLEGHGRETLGSNLSIDRTVGWFTSVYPVAVESIGQGIREDIMITKESLRQIPNRGIGYGILKYLGSSVIKGVEPEITFNYLGEFDERNDMGNWKISQAPRGEDIPESNVFGTAISFNGAVMERTLSMTLTYRRDLCSSDEMSSLAEHFKSELLNIIEHCILSARVNRSLEPDMERDMTATVWSKFNEDCLLRNIKTGQRSYTVLFVENLTAALREAISEQLSKSYPVNERPHFIVGMHKYSLSSSIMDEYEFRNLCFDPEMRSEELEADQWTEYRSTHTTYEYSPSILQQSFLKVPGTMVHESVLLSEGYAESEIIEAVRSLIKEQGVLRSSYRIYDDGTSAIEEHPYLTSWYVPYLDQRYAKSDDINEALDKLVKMVQEGDEPQQLSFLSRIVVTRTSELDYVIHVIAHHSVWDKASTHLLKEKLASMLSGKQSSNGHSASEEAAYRDYVNELSQVPVMTHFNELNPAELLLSVQELSMAAVNNPLKKSVLTLFKMGPKVLELYRERPWTLLIHLAKTIIRENGLDQSVSRSFPLFLLQEDRTFMNKDYSNVMGEFLDLIPVSVDVDRTNMDLDMQGKIEGLQKWKKEQQFSYIEMLGKLNTELPLCIPSMLSINYQGTFELTYQEVQNMMNNDSYRDTPEIFANHYEDHLVLFYPTYSQLQGDLEDVIRQELTALEAELQHTSAFSLLVES